MTLAKSATPTAVVRSDRRGRLLVRAEQRHLILEAFDASALSAMAFSRQHGLCYSTFGSWVHKRRKDAIAQPSLWRRIGQEHSDSFDYQPGRVFVRRLIRHVFVSIADRDVAPVTAKLPPRLQDVLTAAHGLIAHTLISKYCDHLPFYRQEKILATRHGVDIGRNTLRRWTELAAFWLQPIYQRIHSQLLAGDYIQADETPVKYLAPVAGKANQGYL